MGRAGLGAPGGAWEQMLATSLRARRGPKRHGSSASCAQNSCHGLLNESLLGQCGQPGLSRPCSLAPPSGSHIDSLGEAYSAHQAETEDLGG